MKNNLIGVSGKLNSGKDTIAQMIQGIEVGITNNIPLEEIDLKYINSFYVNSIWKTKRFADKLKDITCMFIGCTREQLEDREFKEEPLGEEWNCWEVKYKYDHPAGFSEQWEGTKLFLDENKAIDWSEDNYLRGTVTKRQFTPRLLMQLLGTEAGRQTIHPNLWVNALFADWKEVMVTESDHNHQVPSPVQKWLIPDTRFPNETKAIKDRGGILIRVNRPIKTRQKGSSETNALLHLKNSHPSETALDAYTDWDYVINNDSDLDSLLWKVKEIYKHAL